MPMMETTTAADHVTALRVALGAGPHPEALDPGDVVPLGEDDPLPDRAAEALATRSAELAERARRLDLT